MGIFHRYIFTLIVTTMCAAFLFDNIYYKKSSITSAIYLVLTIIGLIDIYFKLKKLKENDSNKN